MFTSCAYIMENYSENFFMHSTNCNFNKRVKCTKNVRGRIVTMSDGIMEEVEEKVSLITSCLIKLD